MGVPTHVMIYSGRNVAEMGSGAGPLRYPHVREARICQRDGRGIEARSDAEGDQFSATSVPGVKIGHRIP